MTYQDGYYSPDFTGQYGAYGFNTVKVWLPDPDRYPVQPSVKYKVFITTQDNAGFIRYDVGGKTGIHEKLWFADPLEYKFLENGWAVAMIGYDGARTGDIDPEYQTDSYSYGKFYWPEYSNNAWDLDNYTSPQHDFVRGVQYLKRQSDIGVGSSSAKLNKEGFIAYGHSSAGQAIQYSLLHTNLSTTGVTGYKSESSRIKGAFLVNSQTDWNVMRLSTQIDCMLGVLTSWAMVT